MTEKTLKFCDSCLEDIPDAAPDESFPSYIALWKSGKVGLDFQGGTKHFHDSRCLTAFLASALSEDVDQ